MAQEETPTEGDIGVLELVRAALVLLVLVGLTVYLVEHYGSDEKKAAALLGIIAPVLGAAVGVSIGFTAGKAKGKEGKTDAVKAGRKRLADHLRNQLQAGGAEAVGETEDPRLQRMSASLDAVDTE